MPLSKYAAESDPLAGASWYRAPVQSSPYYASTVSPGWDASRRELMGFIRERCHLLRVAMSFDGTASTFDNDRPKKDFPLIRV